MGKLAVTLLFVVSLLMSDPAKGSDDRELVKLPDMMRSHMLGNMRDHLKAMDEIFNALAQGENSKAAKIAESRLGLSSMGAHGASHMAPFMPEVMQGFGTSMHKAASRFAYAIELADLEPTIENQKDIYRAFQEITQNCTACHEAYRLH